MKWHHSPEYTHARSIGEKYGAFRIIKVSAGKVPRMTFTKTRERF